MQSNRDDFLEMRAKDAIEHPLVEREQQRKPNKISKLERRVNAYENAVTRNKIRKFGLDHVLREKTKNRTDLSDMETRPLHNHAKPLTSYQKLRHTPKYKEQNNELPTTEDIKESFKSFKKSRNI